MNILVTNVYSYKNKGDGAIVISLIREIERVFDRPYILIQTTDAVNDRDKYGRPVSNTLMWLLLSSVRDKPIIIRILVPMGGLIGLFIYLTAFNIFRVKLNFVLSKSLRKYVEEIEPTDLVIACGGGYLNSSCKSPRDLLLLIVTCSNFLSATYMKKKVCLYSQSIGPVYGIVQNKVLRFTLNRVNIIEPRENISTGILEKMGVKTEIIETADAALLLGGSGKFPKTIVKLRPGSLHVGITVRQWFKRSDQYEKYILAIANTIDYLVDVYNAEVFYIPQVIAEDFSDDDRIAALKVRELVRHKKEFKVIDADLHPYEVIGICSRMDVFIGTRMHSNIFALISHVPVIAIEYEHKTRGIMRSLGLEELTVKINDVTTELLKNKVDKVIADRQRYARLIEKNLPAQITKSRSAIEYIRKIYEE